MMKNLFSLQGRVALVTGSSQGIGLAIAEGLAQAGATVILNGRDVEKLEAAAKHLQRAGHKIHSAAFDVTDETATMAAVSDIIDKHGAIDILFNNAGMQFRTALEDYPIEKWRELMRVNVESAFIVGKAVAKNMIARKSGKIINICSVQSELGFKTPLNQALVDNPEFSSWLEKRTPAGRWGTVDELIGAAVFLSSDASSFVNGHILYVDGGITSVL
jgi:gluconate 5-dehydrogenase